MKPISGDQPDHSFLKLSMSDRRSHLWGYFKTRIFSGYLRSNALHSPKVPLGEKLRTIWRSLDNDDSRERVHPDNVLNITFLEPGKLKGEIHCAGATTPTMIFVAVEDTSKENLTYAPPRHQWKDNWKQIAQRARKAAGIRKRPRETTSDTDSDYVSEDSERAAKRERRERKTQKRRAAADIVAEKIFTRYDQKQAAESTRKVKGKVSL